MLDFLILINVIPNKHNTFFVSWKYSKCLIYLNITIGLLNIECNLFYRHLNYIKLDTQNLKFLVIKY